MGANAERGLDKYVFKKLPRLPDVRRFVFAWVLLVVLLMGGIIAQTRALTRFYQELRPAEGGTYVEGIAGSFTNANPIYASGPVDATVSRLVFSGLMQYNSDNTLVGDLATSLQVDERAVTYTVELRQDVTWHDGKPFTAEDVVFTYETIQNPDAKSPLLANWQDIKVQAKSEYSVVFTLPHGLASFPHSLTNGIVPKHLLSNIPSSQLRSIAFNTANPVGTGPFKWNAVQVIGNDTESREEQIGLFRNDEYYKGPPKLDGFLIRAFHNPDMLTEALAKREVNGVSGLESIPDSVPERVVVQEFSIPIMGQITIFMKNSSPVLSDKQVRQALTYATNADEVISGLEYPVIRSDAPLLKRHVGYNPNIVQRSFNRDQAEKLLDKAGWKEKDADGIRIRDEERLTIRLYSKSNSQYSYIANLLQQQWRAIGVDLEVILQPDEDLQSTIAFHNYDMLLYGITIGNDPDVYAYWHSSQADVQSAARLNFSEYKSDKADAALEGGRSRTGDTLRSTKYKPFLQAWREDAPAIMLYQPRFLYATTDKVHGFEPSRFVTSTDRFANVEAWAIRESRQNIID